jgi:hypothetical protein
MARGRSGVDYASIEAKNERMILKAPSHLRPAASCCPKKSKEPAVPTTIPVRVSETRSDDGLVSFCLALLPFYVVLALVLLSITGVEKHFGMYPSVTFSEALFGTYGVDAEAIHPVLPSL